MRAATLVVCCSLVACRHDGRDQTTGAEKKAVGEPIVVEGPSEFDFGLVKNATGPLVHEFSLRNESSKALSIIEVRKSCGCLEAVPDRRTVEPSESVAVSVSIDGRKVYGERSVNALVVFEGEIPPVRLTIEAFIEPSYFVVANPTSLVVPRAAVPGEKVEARIAITEFMSHQRDYDLETNVVVEGLAGAQIRDLGEWKSRGWQFTGGFMRTGAVLITYTVPSKWDAGGQITLTLRFQKTGPVLEDTAPNERPRQDTQVVLTRL